MDSWPSEEAMMKLAMENNLSETAFIVKEEKGYHLRWLRFRKLWHCYSFKLFGNLVQMLKAEIRNAVIGYGSIQNKNVETHIK